jgi:hypothetical protein
MPIMQQAYAQGKGTRGCCQNDYTERKPVVALTRRCEASGTGAAKRSHQTHPHQEVNMSTKMISIRSIALACALCAAVPAMAQSPKAQQQGMATLKKEINAAYAQQKTECGKQAKSERASCLDQARQTYDHDMKDAPRLVANAPTGGIQERTISTVDSGGASATHPRPPGAGPNWCRRAWSAPLDGRNAGGPRGAMLVHALAHIEFNAVNLALDAIWRFPGMPPRITATGCAWPPKRPITSRCWPRTWPRWAMRLRRFPGHDSLWEMVEKTRGDVLARMALVPRTMEARGLDAIPPLRAKLAQAGDHGGRHPRHHPARRSRPRRDRQPLVFLPVRTARAGTGGHLRSSHVQYKAPVLKGPFNIEARRRAGFLDAELHSA